MRKYISMGFLTCLAFFNLSCAKEKEFTWQAVLPEGSMGKSVWTSEELSKDPATHNLKITNDSSFHLLHLRGSEKPHTHDDHDLYAFMISGECKLTMAGKTYELKKDDAVFIPRRTVHWAENVDPKGSDAYVVFVPALTERDYHELGRRTL